MPESDLGFSFAAIEAQAEERIENALRQTLEIVNKTSLFHSLSYLLLEMAGNAYKANLKRAHFALNNLDINDPKDYKEGIDTFKKAVLDNQKRYLEHLKEHQLLVSVRITARNNNLQLIVVNNAPILPVERERISQKIAKSAPFRSIHDITLRNLEKQEGGGIGIILIIMMLRKMGLEEDNFQIRADETRTTATVTIPLTLLDTSESDFVAETIMQELEDIPQLPEHILTLQHRLNNPDANFNKLAEIINRDPSLTADILKLANSPLYSANAASPRGIQSLKQAVITIGFRGIKNHILSYAANSLLKDRYQQKQYRNIMQHSVETAYIALAAAKELALPPAVEENAFSAGMLHDIGRIIASAIAPDLLENIQKLCARKGVNPESLEDLTSGYNHSIIGAKLAEQWHFPPILVNTIRYHHIPLQADEGDRQLVGLICIADRLSHLFHERIEVKNVCLPVREQFMLADDDVFRDFCGKIRNIVRSQINL